MAVALYAPVALILALLLNHILPAYADGLALGAALTPSSPPLLSASGAFTLSFRPFSASAHSNSSSSSASLYLAISFSSSPNSHPAWVVNRDHPVSSAASLSLSSDGSLTLSDRSGLVWSSSTAHLGVARAQLLDSGNLVLLTSSSHTVWQSFDLPTDTLLPGQRFGIRSQLLSQKRSDSFASGRYSLSLNREGVASLTNTEYVYNMAYTADYWSWGIASAAQSSFLEYDQYGKLSLYGSLGVVNSYFVASDYGSFATRRLTLDIDGNLRMYSWDVASSQWIRVWLAFSDQCTRVRSLCGEYGICMLDPEPVCTCPPGFSVVDPADLSGGCRPNHPLSCSTTDLVPLESTDFPFNDYFDNTDMSEADCKNLCSATCNCLGAVYWQTGDGHCWLKSQILNGYSLQSQHFRTFLKVSGLNLAKMIPISDSSTQWSTDTVWQRVIQKEN